MASRRGAVQREGDGARAVVAGRDEGGVAAAVDVGQADQLVAGPDDLLDRRGRGHRRGGEPVDVAGERAGHEQLGLAVAGSPTGADADGCRRSRRVRCRRRGGAAACRGRLAPVAVFS